MDTQYMQQAHSLNSTAAVVWENLNGENSPEDLANLISQEFEIDNKTAKSDVESLLKSFRDLQLIED